jgi:hypothetical protein
MKKTIVLVIAVILALPAFSQLNFGIMAGVSTTSVAMDNVPIPSSSYTIKDLKSSNFGFHAGVFLRLGIKKLYVQPELLLSTRSTKYSIMGLDTTSVTQVFTRLNVPVMLGFKFGPIRLNAGPSFNFLINSPKDLIKGDEYKSINKSMTMGYQAGLGLDVLKKLTIDLRFEGSLKRYQNQIQTAAGDKIALDDRPNTFLLSFGYKFGK